MHIDGTEPRPVSAGPANTVPMWRPDSSAILFVKANDDLWQVDVVGGTERSLKGLWPARSGESAKTFYPRAISRHGLVAGFENLNPGRGGGVLCPSRRSMGRRRRNCSTSRSPAWASRLPGPRMAVPSTSFGTQGTSGATDRWPAWF